MTAINKNKISTIQLSVVDVLRRHPGSYLLLHLGPAACVRWSIPTLEAAWRKAHREKPVQRHVVLALVKRGLVAEVRDPQLRRVEYRLVD